MLALLRVVYRKQSRCACPKETPAVDNVVETGDVRGKEREKTGTGKKLERNAIFPFPFLQILTSAHPKGATQLRTSNAHCGV